MDFDRRQLRLSSCVQTLLDVHSSLEQDWLEPRLVKKLSRLKRTLMDLELIGGSEIEVCRVEEATNRLMAEMGRLFYKMRTGSIYSGDLH